MLCEIDILRVMNHEYVIRLYEVYESEKYIHLVFDFLEGGELFEKIVEMKRFSEV